MAIYGTTVVGPDGQNVSADRLQTAEFGNNPSAITVRSVWVYILSSFTAGEFVRFVIYDNSGSFPSYTPNNLLGQTGEVEGEGVSQWYGANLQSPVALSSGVNYWLGVHAKQSITVRKDTTIFDGERVADDDAYSDGPNDPFTSAFSTGFGRHSFYADEDAIGGDGAVAAALAVL